MVMRVILALCALLLLAGCGGPDEDGFVKGMRRGLAHSVSIQYSDQELLDYGYQVCDYYSRGMTSEEIWESNNDLGNMVGSAMLDAEIHLCPEYR